MHIHFATTFGFENVYPKLVNNVTTQIHGNAQYGEKGLLEFLELHLGKRQLDVSNALRVSVYRKTIQALLVTHPDLYIANSFQKDGWGTALQLLVWRDELKLTGWDFNCQEEKLKRLFVLSLIEKELQDLPNGVNDRWRQILDEIQDWTIDFPIHKISVYEPKELMNPFFTELFNILLEKEVEVNYISSNSEVVGDTDLANFKRKLNSNIKLENKFDCKNDGSLLIVKADNDKLIADALGEYLSKEQDVKPVFIIPERGGILEEALVQRGMPAIGYTSRLENTAFDQLLSLIPLFLWDPIDMEKLMQYLTSQNAPINKDLRRKLMRNFANRNEEELTALMEDEKVKKWFSKSEFDISSGAPRNAVIELYEDLRSWATKCIGGLTADKKTAIIEGQAKIDKKLKPLQKVKKQCLSLINLIKSEKKEGELIHIIELQKWINALESDRFITKFQQEKGAFEYTLHPANITADCDTIIYWNFSDQGNPVRSSANWTAEETIQINVPLHTVVDKIELWYRQLMNGVVRAKKQLILCIPANQQGMEIDSNSLFYDLTATFKNLNPITYPIDVNSKIEIGQNEINTKQYPSKELPQTHVAWKIKDTEKLIPRDSDSFSSLSKLFYHPSGYVLNYLLKIRPIEIPEMEITSRLKGNITHHVAEALWTIENLFELSDEDLSTTIQQKIAEQIKKEGAIFYAPKHALAKMEFEKLVLDSLIKLINAIIDNGWTFLESEQNHKIKGAINVNGFIDLVLTRGENEIAIVDLKWAGLSTKKKELLEQRELQLLIYDRLMNMEGKTTYLHYYIVTSKEFVSRSTTAFKDATVVELDNITETEHRKILWNKMVNTYNERWRQIKEGKIEVGDDKFESALAKEFPMWQDKTTYLSVPVKSQRKEADLYSSYKNLNGRS